MCAVNVPAAHAGHWEFVPLPTDYSARQADASERYPGNIETTGASTWNGYGYGEELTMYPYSYLLADMMFGNEDGSSGSFGAGIGSTGGEGSVIYNGTIQAKLRYIQDTITDGDGNMVPDPNDVPRTPFSIKVTASSNLSAMDGVGNGDVRMPSKESVSASITSAGNGTVQSDASDVRYGEPYAKYLDSSRTIYVLVDPQGELTKTIPIVKFDTKALLENQRKTQSGDSGDEDSHWNEGSVQNWSQFSSEITNYGLTISSDIEPSWKKLEGELPQEYKKFSGQWGWQPDPNKAQQVSADPLIWRVKCHPGADGSMMVESAATWSFGSSLDAQGESATTYFWYGGGVFTANPNGFTSPTYNWNVNANTGVYNGSVLTLADSPHSNPFGPNWIDLGSGRHLPTRSSAIAVTAADSMVSLTSNYTVNWHEPLENPTKIKTLDAHTNYDTGASSWTPMNTPITVTVKPASIVWSLLGGGSALGSAGVAFVGGPVGAAVGLALTAAGLILSENAPQDIVFTRNFSYGDYSDAIRREYNVQNGQADSDDNHWRIAGLNMVELTAAYDELTDAGDVTGDSFYSTNSGSIQGRIAVARPWEKNEWEGDTYSKNGFEGVTNYNLEQEQAPIYVSLVSFFGDTQPMPRPTPTPTGTPTPTATPSP